MKDPAAKRTFVRAAANAARARGGHLAAASLLSALPLAGCGGGGDGGLTALDQPISLEPATVATALAFESVAMGYESSCMLTANGEAWCWGRNDDGQLGTTTTQTCSGGDVACTWQPVRAAAPLRFAALSPAQRHSCGLDAAGQAWCWGFGLGGQLGDGRRADSTSAVAVAGGHRFVQIDSGRTGLVGCALDDAGAAWCWGPAGGGTLGDGTTAMSATPVKALAPQAFVSLGAGDEHACGLDATGLAWCWGRNVYGSLGRGVSGAGLLPAPVVGGPQFASLAVGGVFTCGLTAAGEAHCWGFAGSLGDGVGQHRGSPAPVAGGHRFASLSAGYQHACGLESDGSAWCWGPAMLVGGGTERESLEPVAVAGGHRFRVLRAGGVATCAITLGGVPMCWGGNAAGSAGQSKVGS